MWVNVLLLALAVNLEPTRIGLVPLLLARERPLLQLIAFLGCNLSMSLGFGMIALLAFQNLPTGIAGQSSGRVQSIVGAFFIVLAAALLLRGIVTRRRRNEGTATVDEPTTPHAEPGRIKGMFERIRELLQKGRSPWVAGLVGVGVGLPSVDYLAVLAIIAAAPVALPEKVLALLVFVIVGSLVVLTPLAMFVVAPASTAQWVDRFGSWIRSRSQIEYACMLAAIGGVMIWLAKN